ncbi:cytochrome c peroxidase [uncultured Algibacter sp.]|uniref:cytochrome-c peroxidase n=1 Tax=uncultured Algibacter sp. TaxID=298659 RepID=UPI00262C822B|nr:cytochrome c peroxidase [uncultured Algibacter sp.]
MSRYLFLVIVILCMNASVVFSCKQKKDAQIIDINEVYLPLPDKVKHPDNNKPNEDKINLGKLLFYDPILSGNKDVACATCHHPEFGYAESLDLSIGVNGNGLGTERKFKTPNTIPRVKRNAHTILNTAFNGIDINSNYTPLNSPMFWDARENSLEDQALMPIQSYEEMRGPHFSQEVILDTIVNRLKYIPEYVQLFKEAFKDNGTITEVTISKAIACFERTLVTNNSRFDTYLKGDESAISQAEMDGFNLFKKAKCNACHNGPMFSDYKMHVLGVADNDKLKLSDSGFQKSYAFKTPTLRNLRYTVPYMHNGTFNTLQEVLEFYQDLSSGHSKNINVQNHQIDSLVKGSPLKVKDMSLIISFLNSLNSEDFDKSIPKAVPSKLSVGGNIY